MSLEGQLKATESTRDSRRFVCGAKEPSVQNMSCSSAVLSTSFSSDPVEIPPSVRKMIAPCAHELKQSIAPKSEPISSGHESRFRLKHLLIDELKRKNVENSKEGAGRKRSSFSRSPFKNGLTNAISS
jgi:hypothetical protein